jgi:hypothetical protein
VGRSALVVAHPGHELQVHGWLEKEKPLVLVLTDGSGSVGESRLMSSRRLLAATGARPAPVFGACTDRDLYAAILGGDTAFFLDLVERITTALAEQRIDTVVGDSAEGYNSGHDACRLLVDAAVARRARAGAGPIDSYDYPVVGGSPEHVGPPAMQVSLDDAALERKLAAARRYEGLDGEVEAAIDRLGIDGLRTERFFRVTGRASLPGGDAKPFYETYGERQVAAGRYATVLRFAEHMLPLAKALCGER